MHRRTASRTALLVSLLIGAAACGTDEDAATTGSTTTTTPATTAAGAVAGDDHPDAPEGGEESAEPVTRLLVADPAGGEVALLDLDDPADVATLEVAAPVTGAATTHDGRFVVLRHEDGVTIVDGGAWSEGHGDHDHHFVAAPAVVGEVEGDHPSHLISEDGRLALFFDGTGEAVVLDEDALADGEVAETGRIATAAPHHGFALPVDGGFVVTDPAGAPDGELPEAVRVTDAEGTPGEAFPCAATHGEAAIDGGAAAACADGVLVLRADGDAWEASTVAYPEVDDVDPYGDPAARAWSLAASPDGDALVGVLGTRHLVRVDVAGGTAEAVDLGVAVAGRGLVLLDDGVTAAVLATDGVLRLVDTVRGTVTGEVEVMAPFVEGEDDVADRQVVAAGEGVWVTDPTARTATEVTLDGGPVVGRTVDLPVVPGAVQVVGG